MVSDSVGLNPQLLLPAGMRSFYRPLLRGIADAARDSRHRLVTVVVGGVTDPAELVTIGECGSSFGAVGVGGSLQSLGALVAGVDMVRRGFPVWVDVAEIVRTYFGFPSALSLAGATFDSYVAQGAMVANPMSRLDAVIGQAINRFVDDASEISGVRVGVVCGAGLSPVVVAQLHDAGFRTFALSGNQAASVRLHLGQHAANVTSREGENDA
jgi:pyruvate,orthophosphate dikinase